MRKKKRKYEIAVISKGAYARTLRIYVPKKADRAIIMHDGQNVFYDGDSSFGKSWRAIDVLGASGVKNTAVIGIDSTNTRDDDYMPFPSELGAYGVTSGGGKADEYVDYIETKVIPYLDGRFGFKFYGMLGSSAGALATLYFASRRNARVKAYGMFSTPLFVSSKAFDGFFETARFDETAYYAIYAGGSESVGEVTDPELSARVSDFFVNDALAVTNAVRASGAKKLWLSVENESVHDETSWRLPEKRFMTEFSKL